MQGNLTSHSIKELTWPNALLLSKNNWKKTKQKLVVLTKKQNQGRSIITVKNVWKRNQFLNPRAKKLDMKLSLSGTCS